MFVSANCVDRHYEVDPERIALIWEKDEPGTQENITYRYIYKQLSLSFNASQMLRIW